MEEHIHGFTILKRELTEEESEKEITLERFHEFHGYAGEDFCDTVGIIIDTKVLGGYLMGIYPEFSSTILSLLNSKSGSEPLEFLHMFEEKYGLSMKEGHIRGDDIFYTTLSKFANLTKDTKKRINQILIQVAEHYKD